GKFCGKLCARSMATSARFAVKFCRRAAEPSAACGGCSEAEQGQRSQNASAVQGAPHDAGAATRTFQRGKRAELALASRSVAPFAACRGSRHAEFPLQGSLWEAGGRGDCRTVRPDSLRDVRLLIFRPPRQTRPDTRP